MDAPRPIAELEARSVANAIERLEENIAAILRGKREVIRLAVVALLAKGHILIEDVPGVGKTTLAQALARSFEVEFQRIQFTSDLLPSDIIGISIYDSVAREFRFSAGPLFANVVLADEINRATPKTQSALLEAMSEGKVSVERQRYLLPEPFLVIATQNPLEHEGTFPLPESQLDRFLMSLEIGYPPRDEERALLLSGGVDQQLEKLGPVLTGERLLWLQQEVPRVQVADKLAEYMLQIAEETRVRSDFRLGISTRGLQCLFRAVQALALYQGRDYAIPDDVQELASSVLAHRLILRSRSSDDSPRRAVERLLASIPVPV